MQFNDILAREGMRRVEITDQGSIKSFVRRRLDQTSQDQKVWLRMKVVVCDKFPQDVQRPWSAKANDANPTAAGRRS